jgi:hypothetical protein
MHTITATVARTPVEIVAAYGKNRMALVHAATAWADCGWNGSAERVVPFSALENVQLDGEALITMRNTVHDLSIARRLP